LSQADYTAGSGYLLPIFNATSARGNKGTTSSNGLAGTNGATGSNETSSRPEEPRRESKSTGVSADIGVGVGLIALLLVGGLLSWKKGWGAFRRTPTASEKNGEKAELYGEGKLRIEAIGAEGVELPDKQAAEVMGREDEHVELEVREPHHEVDGLDLLHEMDGGNAGRPIFSARSP
jgi:hypothetical protein